MKRIQTTQIYQRISEAIEEGYTAVSLQGGARSGKTYNVMIWLVLYALAVPRLRISVVRATLPSLKRSVLEDFKAIMTDIGIFEEHAFNRTDLFYLFPTRSRIEFFAVNDEQRLRGSKRDILFINEANELTEIQFRQLKMRTTRFTIVDYNPSFTPDHWIARDLNRDPRTMHFVSTYRDNPFLEPAVVAELESLKNKNRSLWQVYGLGEMAQVEGLIFTNYSVIEAFPPDAEKHARLGIDFGFTNDPTAIVRVSFDGESLFLDEVCYRTRMLQSEIIDTLKLHRDRRVISESADPRLIEEIHRAGINIHPVRKYSGSVQAGIAWMQQHPLLITAQSVNLLKERANYTWAQDKEGNFINTPIDAYNHAFDATRYVCMTEWMAGNKKPINLSKLSQIV